MKKETSIAILLGISFGLILSFFMITKTKDKSLEKTKTLSNEKKATIATHNLITQEQTFKISSPQNKAIVNTKTVTIKGTVEKDALVVIQSPVKDMVFKSDRTNFSVDFPLAMGENIIQISVYPKDAQERIQQKELRVYYLDE